MSYTIIPNIKTGQFGTVFKIDKKEGYRGARINKIVCQNNVAQISYNNNALRFMRLGIDYRNKPLKYLYKGYYDKNKPYYLLNQIFLPPRYNYYEILDYEEQINEIVYNSPLSGATEFNKNIHLEYGNQFNGQDTTTLGYRMITSNIPGTTNIPDTQNTNNIDGIKIKVRFKRSWKTENLYCNCVNKNGNNPCLCNITPEINCNLLSNTTITSDNFIIKYGTDNDLQNITETNTLIFMNLTKDRLLASQRQNQQIQLQNGDQLLVINELNTPLKSTNVGFNEDVVSTNQIIYSNPDNSTTHIKFSQYLIEITGLQTEEYYVKPKNYYLCPDCLQCHCSNRYMVNEGVYSYHFMIPKKVNFTSKSPNGDNNNTTADYEVNDEMDIYIKDCSCTYEFCNGENIMKVWNKNFDIVVDPKSFKYIIKKEPVKTCNETNIKSFATETRYWQDGKQVSKNELDRTRPFQKNVFVTTGSDLLETDYIITGWEMDIRSISVISNGYGELYKSNAISDLEWVKKRFPESGGGGEQRFHTQIHNPIKYITKFVNESGVLVSETLYSNAKVSYAILKGPSITSTIDTGTYSTGSVYNPFPHLWITNWKTSPILFDQLFYNTYMNNDLFILASNHNDYYFPLKIFPVEFTTNIKADISTDFKTLSFEGENHFITNRYYALLLPTPFAKKTSLNFNKSNPDSEPIDDFDIDDYDFEHYYKQYLFCDKYYSLFGQFQRSAWFKLGIVCNYIDESKLRYHKGNFEWYGQKDKSFRIYNMIGNSFTQELYLYNDFVLNQRLFNVNTNVCRDHINLLNPYSNIYNEVTKYMEAINPSSLYNEYPYKSIIAINQKEFKLYKHGFEILTNEFLPMLEPSISYNDVIYLLKISFDDKIDYIINNHLDQSDIQKNNIKFVDVQKNNINYNLEFKNLLYTFDETTSKSIWLYLDSQYHYPFTYGNAAHIEIEYIPN